MGQQFVPVRGVRRSPGRRTEAMTRAALHTLGEQDGTRLKMIRLPAETMF
jgi:hypothetical protein